MAKSETSVVVHRDHVLEALTLYLRSMSLIDDDQYVTGYDFGAGNYEFYLETL